MNLAITGEFLKAGFSMDWSDEIAFGYLIYYPRGRKGFDGDFEVR